MNRLIPVAIAVAVVLAPVTASAQSLAETGRALLESHRDSVVTLQLVVNIKASFPGMGSRESEERVEATGVIIDPSGLGVASLTEVDPTVMFQAMGGARGMSDGSFESDVADAKYLFASGDEVDVEIVLRDPDLDLAFFRPAEPMDEAPAHLDLTSPGTAQLLDELLVINRMGRVTNRVYSVSVERVEAIMERPRLFYIPGKQDTRTGLGCPVFGLDGKIIGFTHLRTIKGSGGSGDTNMTSVILPVSDVAELIPEALKAEAEAPAPPSEDEPVESAPEGDGVTE